MDIDSEVAGGTSAKDTDAVIVAGLAEHDETALRRLIDTCAKYVYERALRILWEPRLAEDVARDTLLTLWWDPARYDASKGSLRSFLIGVARFKAIDLVRHGEVIRSRDFLAFYKGLTYREVGAILELPEER